MTKSRLMPPWKSEPGYGEFIGHRPLSDTEIGVVQRWLADGALEGDPRDLPPPPQWTEGWQLGKPDLVVTLSQPYVLPADGTDVSRGFVLPVDVEVQAVQPHAHYRARQVTGVATLTDGTTKWLIYIKDWDFRWQHVYRYVTPIMLPKGTTLALRYTFDNSADNPRNPRDGS